MLAKYNLAAEETLLALAERVEKPGAHPQAVSSIGAIVQPLEKYGIDVMGKPFTDNLEKTFAKLISFGKRLDALPCVSVLHLGPMTSMCRAQT